MRTHPIRSLRRAVRRNRATIAVAVIAVLASSGSAAAASYLVLSTSNTATTTTTLKSAVNGSVLAVQNTNSTGGTSARGLSISVPSGRSPISVNSSAGKATNLNADKLDGIDSTGFIRGPVSAWHELGPAGLADFAKVCDINGQNCSYLFGNYGSGFSTVAFLKDPFGFVHIKGTTGGGPIGSCSIGGSGRVFTLPAGYRPAARGAFPATSDNSPARIDVFATGDVVICWPSSGSGWSLDGITFRAGP